MFAAGRLALPALLLVIACGGDDGVTALFELPGSGDEFYALPFPNDLRLDDDGTLALADHPRPNDLIAEYVDAIDSQVQGFSLSPVVYFRFGGAIDVESLPADALASTNEDASVYLVDIDPDSPDYGARIPTRAQFSERSGSVIGDNWLAVQTYPGFVLRDATTYAVVVTNRLRASGSAVRRDDAFRELVSGSGSAEAQAVYQPLFDYLSDDGGDESSDVRSAAVFTTQDATALLRAAREVVRGQPAPTPRDLIKIRENTSYVEYEGLWDAANFQEGDPPYRREGGAIALDGSGLPIIQRTEELRFALTTPLGDAPAAGWPVVLYSHGTGGDYQSFVRNGTARRLADRGLAAISMDQVLHGPRDPTGGSPELNFFNFLNPAAARDNTLQGAIDAINQSYMAEGFDITDGDDRRLHFDASAIMFFGHSQGGITGMPFLGVEPNVKGAVLSGSGGLISLSLLLKTEPIDITALISTVIRDTPLDDFNPVLSLVQTYLDHADAINYARYVIREPVSGGAAKSILLGEGFTDRFTPIPSIEALGLALGVELAEPTVAVIAGFEVAGRQTVSLPVENNLGDATGVVVQYEEEAGSDGHFIFFDIEAASTQAAEFLRTLAETGTATVVAP